MHQFDVLHAVPPRAATLWLLVLVFVHPGRRQRSLRSRFLALGFVSVVPSGLSQQSFLCWRPANGPILPDPPQRSHP